MIAEQKLILWKISQHSYLKKVTNTSNFLIQLLSYLENCVCMNKMLTYSRVVCIWPILATEHNFLSHQMAKKRAQVAKFC